MLPLSWKAPGELAWVEPEYDVVAVFPEILRSDSNEDEPIGAFAGVGCGGIWSGRRNGATTGVPTCAGHCRSTATEERNQGSGGIQRLRRRRPTDRSRGQDQRPGSVPHPVSQQRNERRRAGVADGNVSASGQSG